MKKLLFIITVLLGVSLVFYFIVWVLPFLFVPKDKIMNNSRCKDEERILDEGISGIVTAKYRDKESHLWETIEYRNESGSHKLLVFMNDRSGAFDFIVSGDSIFKSAKSLDVKIIRNGVEANYCLDFGCVHIE